MILICRCCRPVAFLTVHAVVVCLLSSSTSYVYSFSLLLDGISVSASSSRRSRCPPYEYFRGGACSPCCLVSTRSPTSSSSLDPDDVLRVLRVASNPFVCYASSSSSMDDGFNRYRGPIEDALSRMNRVMTPEFFHQTSSTTMSLKTFYDKMCKNVEVRDSPIAGQGLFAKKNIKANTIVSFYPAHALGLDDDGGFYSDDPYFNTDNSNADAQKISSSYLHCTDQPLFDRESALQITTTSAAATTAAAAQPNNTDGDDDDSQQDESLLLPPLFLDVNPHRPLVPGWTSQMINDGARVEKKSEQGVLDYYQRSGKLRNCIHIPFGPSPIMATITTKKVKKGDELLTSYGGIYWLGIATTNTDDSSIIKFDPNLPEVSVTPAINAEIRATAADLVASMKAARTVYAGQCQALQDAYDALS